MNKTDFLLTLAERLSRLDYNEVEERLKFYDEMIDDRMEEGLSEEDAVSAVGSVDEIIAQIMSDFPLAGILKESAKPKRRLTGWTIVLLVLGLPLWLPLLIAAFAVVLSLYICLWSVIISLWAVFAAVAGCTVGFLAGGVILLCYGRVLTGFLLLGSALICAGLSIFLFYGCKAVSKGTLLVTKKLFLRMFLKKEAAK